ncbi:hypothetical protein [Treponema endosymbiont of Eucomonympha sp.]|uniref:hypothetical protein n=1 Tax=Treponema endosymbiont of Eucomonympha sp. TaxID=1580831 RepID=UPI00139685A7|nr:hypothetical protein [Treponema endosymbiont of Eucomonympha sp.]
MSIATVQTPHIIGIGDFSLRVKATFPGRKLYCALNISFHHRDLVRLREHIALFGQYSLDVFIIQDLGLLDLLGEYFPHTSTQAKCTDRFGFFRIVMGRKARRFLHRRHSCQVFVLLLSSPRYLDSPLFTLSSVSVPRVTPTG